MWASKGSFRISNISLQELTLTGVRGSKMGPAFSHLNQHIGLKLLPKFKSDKNWELLERQGAGQERNLYTDKIDVIDPMMGKFTCCNSKKGLCNRRDD